MAKLTVNEPAPAQHSLSLSNRSSMNLSGINEVLSFDETSIQLKTACGNMTISGKNIHIQSIAVEDGNVLLTGEIDSVVYSKSRLSSRKTLRDLLR